MSFTYVTSGGNQVTTGTQSTLTTSLTGTIAAGSLVVVDVAWGSLSGNEGPPTHVQDMPTLASTTALWDLDTLRVKRAIRIGA